MPRWKDIENSEKFQELSPAEQGIKKFQFWNDVIQKSPKFSALDKEGKNKVFDNFFPGDEFLEIQKSTFPIGVKELWKSWKEVPGIKQGDVAVNKVADVVGGKVTAEGNIPIEFSRFLAGEVIRGYEPSTLLPFIGATKIAKPILKPAGRFIASHTPEPIKKFFLKNFTVGKGQPLAYQKAAEEATVSRELGREEAESVAKILTTNPKTGKPLPLDQQKYMGRIFRKETIESPELLAHPKYQELKVVADEGRAIMDKWSTELINSGIPGEEAKKTIEENVGSYMARMYSSKLTQTGQGAFGKKQARLMLNGLKKRKDLSDEVRNLMGEIKEPALPTAIRVSEISQTVANAKLFNQVAANPEWSAMTNLSGNMVKMPESATMGALKGKWVIPEIAEDINAITVAQTAGESAYMKALGYWKYGKVVLNPATHSRNIMANSILLDLSGTSHLRQAQLMPEVIADYLKKGELYQMVNMKGILRKGFKGGEIQRIKLFYEAGQGGHVSRMLNVLKMPFKKAGELYGAEEDLSKLIKFKDVLSKGGTLDQAATEAKKWLFDYTKVPKFVELARKSPLGAPFITFTYKAMPRVAESLVNSPLRIYKYYAFAKGFNEASRKTLGMSPEDYAQSIKDLPPWLMRSIGGMPANLLLPYKDKEGRTKWLNLEYILPVGQAPEIAEKGLMKGFMGNPFFTVIRDLNANQDFSGKKIIPPEATKLESIKATLGYVYRQLAPSFAPGIWNTKTGENVLAGGYSFDKLLSVLYKRPDFHDRVRGLTPTLLDTLVGLKIESLELDEAESMRRYQKQDRLIELQKYMMKFNQPGVSEETRDREIQKIYQKMQAIKDEE